MNAKARTLGCLMLVCMAGLALAWAATPATAAVLAYEPFAGSAGELVGQNTGGTGMTGNWLTGSSKTGFGVVAHDNTGVQYTDSTGKALDQSGYALSVLGGGNVMNVGDLFRDLASSIPTTGTYYVSAVIAPARTGQDYGVALPGNNTVLGFYADTSTSYWGIESFNDSSGPAVAASSVSTALLVAKIVRGTPSSGKDTATLWVNPLLGNEAGSGAGTTAAINGSVDWYGIGVATYQAVGVEAGTLWGKIADVRLGETFNDVTPIGIATPEPGSVTLLTTGLLGLLAYAWRKRK
jgi:hypothetical protein